jgi:hypothetical protein
LAPASAYSQHAARTTPTSTSSGRSLRQRSNARAQRGLKAQPRGIALRRGIAPSIWTRRSRVVDDRRNRPHQADGIGVLRRVDHLGAPARSRRSAGVHHCDAVGGLGDHAHVVRHQHHRGAVVAAEPLQERDDLRLDRDVERSRRLVGDDELRVRADGERDHHALAHAARELVREVVDPALGRRDPDFAQEVDRARARRALAHVEVGADRLDELARRSSTAD